MISRRDSDRGGDGEGPSADSRAETTGRQVVVFTDDGRRTDPTALLRSLTGVSTVTRSGEFDSSAMDLEQVEAADAVVFDELGIAVVAADPDQLEALRAATAAPDVAVLSVEPELVHHALDSEDTVVEIARPENGAVAAEDTEHFLDTREFTWGLQATRTTTSTCSGRGVRIAVLDTGFDLTHPDFHGRTITAQSFIPGAAPQDGHGHGTHCIGTACGPTAAAGTRRYGVAHEADIFVGKVLSDQGRGVDGGILAGIEWAIANGCQIVSMSLGADVASVSVAYETVGQRALAAGVLIVAAAGNNANRAAGRPGLVGVPANSPSIMAVAAVDPGLGLANFSAASNPVTGGEIDVAGPGVGVFSSVPMPVRYGSKSGTSMATPHVAGIAALWCAETGRTGRDLWSLLTQHSRRLALQSLDVGAGLIQASG
ncbi:possible subtilisin [Rhodococcus wratislaviensis]|uniref:Possible subtilisin n=1 Tax=Rhodococcus wratislaviensis TaxID=44752 RepID=A0A402C7V4_RHOWR|nr:S8 family serine peptidase [Rhodococcus wratislaviensis]GCE39597.1 possible subtilisin [Rhodococcus wratislaviensis]